LRTSDLVHQRRGDVSRGAAFEVGRDQADLVGGFLAGIQRNGEKKPRRLAAREKFRMTGSKVSAKQGSAAAWVTPGS